MNKHTPLLLTVALGLTLATGPAVAASFETRTHVRAQAHPERVLHKADRLAKRGSERADEARDRGDDARDKTDRRIERIVENSDGSHRVDITGTTGDGRTFEKHVEVTKTENGFSKSVNGTTPNGDEYSHDVVMTRDPEAGTWSKQVSGTTPSGKTYSNNVSGETTDDGFVRTATRTGVNGGTSVRTTTVTKTENGHTKTVTVENTPPQNGEAAGE